MNVIRKIKEYSAGTWTIFSVSIILLLPLSIALGLVIKSFPIFSHDNFFHLLFSSEWKPSSGLFGFLPFILGSLMVTLIGIIIMIPLSLFPAIYLTQYASPRVLSIMRSVIDILAGIPSVIHGLWGVLIIVPMV
jgi:phosphate transport system permease protein